MTDDLSRDAVSRFIDDDDAYLQWISAHPSGFVVNCARKPKSNYLMLHRASCSHLTTPTVSNWTNDYIKVCSEDARALQHWAATTTAGELSPCQVCKPDMQSMNSPEVSALRGVEPTMAADGLMRVVPPQITSGCEELDRAWQKHAHSILERPGVLIHDTEEDLNWHAFLGHSLDMQGFRAAEFVGVDPLSRSVPDFIPLKTRGLGIRELGQLWKEKAIQEHLLGNLRGLPVQATLDVIASYGGDSGVSLAEAFATFPFRKGHWTVRALLQNSAKLEDDAYSFRRWLQRECDRLGANSFPPSDFRKASQNATGSIENALRRVLQDTFYQVGPALAPYMICDWQLALWAQGKTAVFASFKLDSFHEEFVQRFGREVVPTGEQAFAEWWLAQYPDLPPRLANECIWLAMEGEKSSSRQ